MTFPEFLQALTAGGSAVGLGVFISRLLEIWGRFQALTPEQKRLWAFVMQVGIPVVAILILQFIPPAIIASLTPYFNAISYGVAAWAAGEFQHQATKSGRAGRLVGEALSLPLVQAAGYETPDCEITATPGWEMKAVKPGGPLRKKARG